MIGAPVASPDLETSNVHRNDYHHISDVAGIRRALAVPKAQAARIPHPPVRGFFVAENDKAENENGSNGEKRRFDD